MKGVGRGLRGGGRWGVGCLGGVRGSGFLRGGGGVGGGGGVWFVYFGENVLVVVWGGGGSEGILG